MTPHLPTSDGRDIEAKSENDKVQHADQKNPADLAAGSNLPIEIVNTENEIIRP